MRKKFTAFVYVSRKQQVSVREICATLCPILTTVNTLFSTSCFEQSSEQPSRRTYCISLFLVSFGKLYMYPLLT